jgi:hypothetical protein
MPVSELQRRTFAVHGYVLVLILAIVEDVAGSLGGTNEVLDVGPHSYLLTGTSGWNISTGSECGSRDGKGG